MPRVHVYPGGGYSCVCSINTFTKNSLIRDFLYVFTGPVELRVIYGKYEMQSMTFSVDLDSVYKTPMGELVYSLDRVEMEMRNMWQLVIFVELIDGLKQQFTSKAFRIRTRPKPKQAAGTCTCTYTDIYSSKNL